MGAAGAPILFLSFLPPPRAVQNGRRGCPKRDAEGALNAAPFPRRAREIPPKAGISRVYIYIYIFVEINFWVHDFSCATFSYTCKYTLINKVYLIKSLHLGKSLMEAKKSQSLRIGPRGTP